ncbi:hypothetical protein MLD38_021402 [Melastoma candidum]|uniref:Uncharacterized protein n=1 Tax=Melastoma candidum TaxID=119954 RepID=A0ACB9QF76_9MYRT|nr:hypothetical protein MLD38_021402 [Melastoma candidum]
MKFGETFTEYLRGDREGFLGDCSHVEYKRLKKVLKGCRSCRGLNGGGSADVTAVQSVDDKGTAALCRWDACPICDQMFFSELMKEASDIAGCFGARVRHLLDHHVATGVQRYILRLRQCFGDDRYILLQQGRLLMEYVTMNAIAIRKILKKYDKVHGSESGKNFRSKLRAEHIELLQSPWLMELGAFYLNLDTEYFVESDSDDFFGRFSFHFNATQPVIRMSLPDSVELEYDLACAICLDTVFNPYALSCGHFFCKSCACSAASVPIFQGLKVADKSARCPLCREAGVYANSVPLLELDLLLKNQCKDFWKERLAVERAEMLKQSKEYWNLQTKYAIG